jgi:hypothetical protein
MSSVDDLFTTVDLDTGRAAIYDRMITDKAVLVKEFPSREEADAYLQHQLDMYAVCTRIHEDLRALAAKWITDKTKETGLERSLVHEWLEGLDLDCPINEYPAASADDLRGNEEDPMQEPPVVKIPDYSIPVESPKPVFPLPADHECDRQGVPALHAGEWEYADIYGIPYLMA